MKARLRLIYTGVLFMLVSIWATGYACCVRPVACFTIRGASATDNRFVAIDDLVGFGAECSSDPDGCEITDYNWDFADASHVQLGESICPDAKWGSTGNRTVSLVVTDNDRPCCCRYSSGCTDQESLPFGRTVTVVGVESLDPIWGFCCFWQDAEEHWKKYCVATGLLDTVLVQATPDPSWVTESQLPPGWEMAGGNGTGKLTRTVDVSVPNLETIAVRCGSSFERRSIYVVGMDIIWTVDAVYADAKADVPIVFRISAPGLSISKDSITAVRLKMIVDESLPFDLNVSTNDIATSDLMTGNNTPFTFTLCVPETEYDYPAISFPVGHKSTCVKYELEVDLAIGPCTLTLCDTEYFTMFADGTVYCVEIDVDEDMETWLFMGTCDNEPEKGWQLPDDIESGLLRDLPDPHMIVTFNACSCNLVGWDCGFWYSVALDDSLGNGTGPLVHKNRSGQYHRQKGFYYVLYYGRKQVTMDDETTREIVNPEADWGSFHASAWTGDASVTGTVNSTYTDEGADIPALALDTVGIVWSAITLDIVGFAISMADAVYGGIRDVTTEDDATVYCESYLIRNSTGGQPVDKDHDFVCGMNGWGPAGTHTQSWLPPPGEGLVDFGNQTAIALNTIYGYISTSVTSTDWSIFVWPTHVDAKVEFHPGSEQLVKVRWN